MTSRSLLRLCGVEYNFKISIENDLYVAAYGRQHTRTITLRAGDNFTREVSEQTSH